ncbi:hypothetical protein EJ03DRAFT_3834 [Teratosphaeria nubilosa]|uniref:Uncharacterized protein n=1 Tax=Teratosphaeria nubilosa TaxID=161662 RepID=A0A6G1LN17_9PEZI|nr:hypothetical protein EJ03DRAFT_3834 [Teratosphaeria nubilosa]
MVAQPTHSTLPSTPLSRYLSLMLHRCVVATQVMPSSSAVDGGEAALLSASQRSLAAAIALQSHKATVSCRVRLSASTPQWHSVARMARYAASSCMLAIWQLLKMPDLDRCRHMADWPYGLHAYSPFQQCIRCKFKVRKMTRTPRPAWWLHRLIGRFALRLGCYPCQLCILDIAGCLWCSQRGL